MITGSHNPPEFNGFKTVCGDSTIHGEAIQELRCMIETGALARGEGSERPADLVTPYVDEVASQFHFPRRIRAVVDAGNGTGGPVMHRILERLDVEATEMFFEMDGRFPNHHPDPTVPANLQALIDKVNETGADLGIAFDGDTDRIGAVDEHGAVIWGDQLMIIYGREILTRKPGATFIGEVKCSQSMYDDLAARGGNPIMWKTGHSLIKAKMKETQGGAGRRNERPHVLRRPLLRVRRRSIRRLPPDGDCGQLGPPDLGPTCRCAEDRHDSRDSLRLSRRAEIRGGAACQGGVANALQDSGCGRRARAVSAWLGPGRASNTQPVLVMRFEATTPEQLKEYRGEVEAVVQASKEIVERKG